MLNGTFTGQGQASWNVVGNNDYVAYGGEFPTAGGVPQQGLVRYAVKSHRSEQDRPGCQPSPRSTPR